MKAEAEIRAALPNFYGTENWHRLSPLTPNVLLTDGAKYIADACDAYWLMDVIASHLASLDKVGETFGVAILTVRKHGSASFVLLPDEPCNASERFAKQKIEWTDFPLDEIKFYVTYDGENWVVMLPSEY